MKFSPHTPAHPLLLVSHNAFTPSTRNPILPLGPREAFKARQRLQDLEENRMEKQKRGLKNQWWEPGPSVDVAGEQRVEEGLIVYYPNVLNSPQDSLQLSPSHPAWEPPGGQGSHLCWS